MRSLSGDGLFSNPAQPREPRSSLDFLYPLPLPPLFHVKPHWIRAAEYVGLDLQPGQIETMERYGLWLTGEAMRAGGIGPDESERIDQRHLADSILFATEIPDDARDVWDLGSGAGLPGIPLAICLPEKEIVLVDRAGRRVDLLRRAVRILGLANCSVCHRDIADLSGDVDVIVSRASLPPEELLPVARSHLRPGGTAINAGSWRSRPDHDGWTTIEIPPHVLDQTVWLLIMRQE